MLLYENNVMYRYAKRWLEVEEENAQGERSFAKLRYFRTLASAKAWLAKRHPAPKPTKAPRSKPVPGCKRDHGFLYPREWFFAKSEFPTISTGNSKLGSIPSWSLPAGVTCVPNVPCAVVGNCYAMKGYLNGSPRRAYARNLRLLREDSAKVFGQISQWIALNNPAYFRIHSGGGDFFSYSYMVQWFDLARLHSNVRFLAFSKRYGWMAKAAKDGVIPGNVRLVASAWPSYPMPDKVAAMFPVAWMDDGTDDRIPAQAANCPGLCSECQMCWHLPQGEAVRFKKH